MSFSSFGFGFGIQADPFQRPEVRSHRPRRRRQHHQDFNLSRGNRNLMGQIPFSQLSVVLNLLKELLMQRFENNANTAKDPVNNTNNADPYKKEDPYTPPPPLTYDPPKYDIPKYENPYDALPLPEFKLPDIPDLVIDPYPNDIKMPEFNLDPIKPPEYTGGYDGNVWGDPHFVGADSEKFDVMGKAGNTYNIFSDKNFQVNAQFDEWSGPDTTIMSKIGLQVGDNKVLFDRDLEAPKVGDTPLKANEKVDLKNKEGTVIGSAVWDGKDKLTVIGTEYEAELTMTNSEHGKYLNHKINVRKGVNPFGDHVAPHGLLGQTFDGIKGERILDQAAVDKGLHKGKGAQGQGYIDGTVTDYEVKDLFDTSFTKNNRFNPEIAGIQENGEMFEVVGKDGNVLFTLPKTPEGGQSGEATAPAAA